MLILKQQHANGFKQIPIHVDEKSTYVYWLSGEIHMQPIQMQHRGSSEFKKES